MIYSVTNEEIKDVHGPKKSLTMADRIKIHQMHNLMPNKKPNASKFGSNRPSLIKRRKKSKATRMREMSPKSYLKEELSKIGKMRKQFLTKTDRKRPKKKTKSSKAVKDSERRPSKFRRDSTFKEKDPKPLNQVLPLPPPVREKPNRSQGLKYSMTLTQINNIFNIDEQENEEERYPIFALIHHWGETSHCIHSYSIYMGNIGLRIVRFF
ncbi:unnamed protein product [Moneuplotes crassus]|uniref:Uncharacterized protein n=1 Tax=Euplotes crassus TaxID=5936 RepID=A0AAD1Y6A0_EUPCR|nr:unnamed protein product [Moneuplotes crassus]